MNNTEKLKLLYENVSKHSNYQILSERLDKILNNKNISVKSRFEKERFDFFCNNVAFKGKNILDIGANTGYFTFELIECGAKSVHYVEGNFEHAQFVTIASEQLDVSHKIKIENSYYNFDKNDTSFYDIILCLNVLHHVGDDFGDKSITTENAKSLILKYLNNMSKSTRTLIFQLGFNWKGERNKGLFENGTKHEMIDFITNGTKDFWQIEKIGIAEQENERIKYKDLNEKNIKRNDLLGEFLNRPIFILKSKK